MADRYVGIFICEDPNEIAPDMAPPGWAWLKPSTGQFFKWIDGEWVEAEITFSNIRLSGTITINNQAGVTKTVNNPTKIKVQQGIVTEVE